MIHVVIGTKAQLVKMAPVMAELQRRNHPYNFIFTGQHQETIPALRENFSLKEPDVVLHRGRDITSVPAMLVWMLRILFLAVTQRRKIFQGDRRGGVVLVHGDTFSTLLGALMGRIAGHRVAHVESGLRSFNLLHPFPEELTRLLVFRLATIYYCPGSWALQNVSGFRGEKIDTRYNTLLDALQSALSGPVPEHLQIPAGDFCIATTHRFENLYSREVLERNLSLIERAAGHMKLLFVMHPVTRRKLEKYGLLGRLESNPRIELRPRYDYFSFMRLVSAAEFVISDGGSNQEECYYLGKPCLLLRKTTERQEGLGENVVLSGFEQSVVDAFLEHYSDHRRPPLLGSVSPVQIICDHLGAGGSA